MSESKRRIQLPWLTREDARMLDALADVNPEARRQMSNLIREQAREQARYERRFEPLEPSVLERAATATGARSGYGTGGGRAKRVPPVDPS